PMLLSMRSLDRQSCRTDTSDHLAACPLCSDSNQVIAPQQSAAKCHNRTHAVQQKEVAVGTRVTSRPPPRTVRATFPHTASLLGPDLHRLNRASFAWRLPPIRSPRRHTRDSGRWSAVVWPPLPNECYPRDRCCFNCRVMNQASSAAG